MSEPASPVPREGTMQPAGWDKPRMTHARQGAACEVAAQHCSAALRTRRFSGPLLTWEVLGQPRHTPSTQSMPLTTTVTRAGPLLPPSKRLHPNYRFPPRPAHYPSCLHSWGPEREQQQVPRSLQLRWQPMSHRTCEILKANWS